MKESRWDKETRRGWKEEKIITVYSAEACIRYKPYCNSNDRQTIWKLGRCTTHHGLMCDSWEGTGGPGKHFLAFFELLCRAVSHHGV